MSAPSSATPVSFRVADKLHLEAPWEVFGERARRYELHFNGRVVEVVRGPLVVEGYGIRVFRPHGERTGIGFQASTDSKESGITMSGDDATQIAAHSDFPTKQVNLPSASTTDPVDVVDTQLWEAPLPRLRAYVNALLAPFDAIKDATPSFGSVRATLSETSIANSAGLRVTYPHTTVTIELAVKAFGGPEGAAPGEYWVNQLVRRIDPDHAGDPVPSWCQYAQDARRAQAPPTGELPVVLPAHVLAGILPSVVGFRLTGGARLRELAPASGTTIGAPAVNIHDDGRFPWGPSSGPVDDEGVTTRKRPLIASGQVSEIMYDLLHASAFEVPATGNGFRGVSFGYRDWLRFTHSPTTACSTLVVEPGTGGSDAELAEIAGDGIWLQQLGWANPDPISGAFGGEIRIGFRIRNGKIAEPVRGGTIGGTVMSQPGTPSLLSCIAAIGSRPSLVDDLSSPTLLVKPLTVAGDAASGST
ncbi:MAG: TldD/PmbA family protein [Thermoplasmata archaeon]|nr:TldD/PmbA family protein [Thermoplasmata archaeon]